MSKITSLTLTCILLYIFIPFYLLPVAPIYRFVVLNLFWIYFLVNHWLQKKVGIGSEKFEKYPEQFSLLPFVKTHIVLFVLLLLNFVIHIYPVISRTILLAYDEPTLVQSGLGLFTRISSTFQKYSGVEFLTFTKTAWVILITVLIVFRKKIGIFRKQAVHYFKNQRTAKILFFLLLILSSYVYFIIIGNTAFHGSLFRYPPVSKFLYFITYSIFGIEEFAPRLIQVILGSIGAIYFHRMIFLYYSKKTAFLGTIIFLFNPLTSYFFNYAELGLGTVSIIIIISFYFIRFLKHKYAYDLLLTFFLIGIGFLYKRSILLMLVLVPFYLIAANFSYIRKNLTGMLKLLWFALTPILPFIIIMSKYTSRGYEVNLSILPAKLSQYFTLLFETHSYIIVVLFCLSLIYILVKEKNPLIFFIFTLFIGYYLFYSLDSYPRAVDRFSLSFVPAIAVFSAVFVRKICREKEYIINAAAVLFGIYLIFISTFIQLPEIQPRFVSYRNYHLEHYPIDEAMEWLNINFEDINILNIDVRNIAFYRDKFEIDKHKIAGLPLEKFNELGKDELSKLIIKNNIGCLMISNGRGAYETGHIDLNFFTSQKEFKYHNGNRITLYLRKNETKEI